MQVCCLTSHFLGCHEKVEGINVQAVTKVQAEVRGCQLSRGSCAIHCCGCPMLTVYFVFYKPKSPTKCACLCYIIYLISILYITTYVYTHTHTNIYILYIHTYTGKCTHTHTHRNYSANRKLDAQARYKTQEVKVGCTILHTSKRFSQVKSDLPSERSELEA